MIGATVAELHRLAEDGVKVVGIVRNERRSAALVAVTCPSGRTIS